MFIETKLERNQHTVRDFAHLDIEGVDCITYANRLIIDSSNPCSNIDGQAN